MKKNETILIALALLGLTLNLLSAPGSGIIAVLTISILAFLYFYFGFALFNRIPFRAIFKKESYKEVTTQKALYSVFSGVFLASTLVGILFKIQSWPGARISLGLGLVGLFAMTILLFSNSRKSKTSFHTTLFQRFALIGGIGLILFIIPQTTWTEFKYRDHPNYVEAMKAAMADPENMELWEKVKEEQIIMREND
jgi:glucan phosphoethanolaminetransferase (alkaline phosphatase superfamily)